MWCRVGQLLTRGGCSRVACDVSWCVSSGGKRGGPIQPPLPDLAAAHYVLDFGCVIKGTTKTRKFKLTNPSAQVSAAKRMV